MSIRLSEFPEYLAAMAAAVAGNFELARANLEALIVKIDGKCESEQLAYVWQLLADVEGRAGNEERGLLLHERALAIDRSNPLMLLLCAKSLLGGFHRPDLALAHITAAEALMSSHDWIRRDDDMPREWYAREIFAVRQQAMQNKS
ncbi:hypothetical protein ISN76_04885 [Dyella halodurans]|uniref:Tetratricopeptide repeat protein n=1 Tax=Dyella halodurans TaxID=1920171 RepID=A0ABV9C1W9_9GAMM|nr:hypothetical protein [Dyella halodurans]